MVVREQVRRLMKAVSGETGAELAEIPEKARRRHGLKQIVRIAENLRDRVRSAGRPGHLLGHTADHVHVKFV